MSQHGFLLLKLTALCALLTPGVVAQNVAMTIRSTHPEGTYWVDGSAVKGTNTFSWPTKSKHILEVRLPIQYLTGWQDTRLSFRGWSDPSGMTILTGYTVTIEADPKIPEFIATFDVQHKITLWVNDTQIPFGIDEYNRQTSENADEPLRPSPYGLLLVEGVDSWNGCITNSRFGWVTEGRTIRLNALPYPGYGFVRWRELDETEFRFPFIQITISRPKVVRAYFSEARRHTFETAPVRGLSVIIDGVRTETRLESGVCLPPSEDQGAPAPLQLPEYDGDFCPYVPPLCTGDRDLLPETEHILNVPELQRDSRGVNWVFDHWDWGGAEKPREQNYKYVVPKEPDPRTMVANFVRGADVTILTVPNGLRINVDGVNLPPSNFIWGLGHKHTIAAPLEQTDANGRRWVFKNWSNGGSAVQEVATDASHLEYAMVLRANYELLGQVTLTSSEASPLFIVGDRECRAPCTLDLPAGTQAVVRVMAEELIGDDIKVKFLSWPNGDQSLERTVLFTEDAQVLTANFVVLNRLRLISDPEDGVDFSLMPQPMEGLWYPMAEEVTLMAEPRRGYKFRRWDGALAGTVPVGRIRMSTPLTVVARLDKIPALKDGAVRNAADFQSTGAVAAGSIIAIDGLNMAAYPEQGPTFPLRQSIQSIYATAGDRLLPLLSVAPETIVALMPSDQRLGDTVITVKTPNQPDLTADIKVVRNAPGLFWKQEGETVYAEAYHEDGKPVTLNDPARRGETIRIAGTGFGPYDPQPPDGFPVPSDPAYRLVDLTELRIEGRFYPVASVVAAPGQHGKVWVRLRITDDMPSGRVAPMSVRVNGVESAVSAIPLK